MSRIKIKPNEHEKSELCKDCKFLYKTDCPKFKFAMSIFYDESILNGIGFMKAENEIDEIVVYCEKHKRDFFLSDIFGFLK